MPGAPPTKGRRRVGLVERLARRLRSQRLVVHDHSMEPEFQPGDRLLLDPAAYRAADPSYGDVVVMIDPADEERLLLKRVAGLPGDVVQLGETIVRAGEAPGTSPGPPGVGEVQIPGNHYFLLSDRSVRTRDSRQFGPVRRGRLIGRVWKRTFPPDRVGEV